MRKAKLFFPLTGSHYISQITRLASKPESASHVLALIKGLHHHARLYYSFNEQISARCYIAALHVNLTFCKLGTEYYLYHQVAPQARTHVLVHLTSAFICRSDVCFTPELS